MTYWWRATWLGDAWDDGVEETHWYAALPRVPAMPPNRLVAIVGMKGWAEGDLTPEQLGDMLTDG